MLATTLEVLKSADSKEDANADIVPYISRTG